MASICIMGSGPAGAFAAVRLADAGHEVMVLETGTHEPDSDPDAFIDRIEIEGGTTLNLGFSRQVGGASNLWAGRVAALDPIDFQHREWVADSGWPFGHSELADYYDRTAQIIGLPLSNLPASEAVPPSWKSLFADSLSLQRVVWNAPPFNAGNYLREAAARLGSRLRLMTDAHCLRLTGAPGDRRIRGAEAIVRGQAVEAQADVFILAAGGIESPRILLNSTARHPAGIGNAADQVGRFLSTHPKGNMALLVLSSRSPTTLSIFGDQPAGVAQLRHCMGLSAARQRELRTLNHQVQLSPLPEYQSNRLFELVKGRVADSPLINRSRAVQGLLPGIGHIAYEMAARLAGLPRSARMFVLRGFLDQYPSSDNRVRRSGSLDRFGCAKADISWRFSDADRRSVVALFAEMDKAFRAAGLGFVDYSMLTSTEEWPITGMHSHFMGATRMGADEQSGVVDAHCRVFGADNLYVSGPSTFRTSGHANPFLTVAAMSLRLAEHINRSNPPGTTPSRPLALVPRKA